MEKNLDLIDTSGMYKVYNNWPELAHNAYKNVENVLEFDHVDHIIFAGMGGSGTIGDLFSSILSKSNLHVSVVKGYRLPSVANENSLVIGTSVSGNTSETLTILNTAKNRNCKIVGFSSGGKLEDFCTKNNLKFNKIDMIHSPRASFPNFFFTMIASLKEVLKIDSTEVMDAINAFKITKENISSENFSETNKALNLANWIKGIPIMYYPWGLKAAAIRFKNSLQENSKMHVITEDVIETCHNGVVAWENPTEVQPILLQGKDDHKKTLERWNIIKEFFNQKNINYFEVFSEKGSIITKLTNLIYLLDYSTIYKAINEKIDPSPVLPIDFVKNNIQD